MTHSIKASPSWLRSSRSSSSGCTALTSHHRAAPCMSFLLSPHSADEAAAPREKARTVDPSSHRLPRSFRTKACCFYFLNQANGEGFTKNSTPLLPMSRGEICTAFADSLPLARFSAHICARIVMCSESMQISPNLMASEKKKKKEQKHRVLNFFYR